MSIEVLVSALEEYLVAKNDFRAGALDDISLQQTKKRLAQALNQYIDWRTDGVIEERQKKLTSQFNTALVNSGSAPANVAALAALNSAPLPPTNEDDFEKWAEQYMNWYNNERKKGMV